MNKLGLAVVSSLIFPNAVLASTIPSTFVYDLTLTEKSSSLDGIEALSREIFYDDLPAVDRANCVSGAEELPPGGPGVTCRSNYIPSAVDFSGTGFETRSINENVRVTLRSDGLGGCTSSILNICRFPFSEIGTDGENIGDAIFSVTADANGFYIDGGEVSASMIAYSLSSTGATIVSDDTFTIFSNGFIIQSIGLAVITTNYLATLNSVTVTPDVAPVPLPAGLPLLAGGLGLLGFLRRRRTA